MDPETITTSNDRPTPSTSDTPIEQPVAPVAAVTAAPVLTRAKVMFEQVELFELEPEEARDTEYLRKLLEPHYPAATDAKFEYKEEGDCLIVTMIKQNPPKG